MSENKEFPIPFDESRRGKRVGHEEKSIGRRLLGRAMDRPTIGDRRRGRGINRTDMPTGGKPGTRNPTGSRRDVDGDGWADEGTTKPVWVGIDGDDKKPKSSNSRASQGGGGIFSPRGEEIGDQGSSLSSGKTYQEIVDAQPELTSDQRQSISNFLDMLESPEFKKEDIYVLDTGPKPPRLPGMPEPKPTMILQDSEDRMLNKKSLRNLFAEVFEGEMTLDNDIVIKANDGKELNIGKTVLIEAIPIVKYYTPVKINIVSDKDISEQEELQLYDKPLEMGDLLTKVELELKIKPLPEYDDRLVEILNSSDDNKRYISKEDGTAYIGKAARTLVQASAEDKEIRMISHDAFYVSKHAQGQGIGSFFNARNEKIYEGLGVRSVFTHGVSDNAGSRGAVHWPKNGFSWGGETEKQKFIKVIDDALTNNPELFSQQDKEKISSLYEKNADTGLFETNATAEELLDFPAANKVFSNADAQFMYVRPLRELVGASSRPNNLRRQALSSGKPPQYPRPPAYGPLIGGAEEYFDGVNSWQEFAEKYRGRDIVWIDYETTGLVFDEFGRSSANGKPVQLGAVKVRDGKIVDRFNVFINPGEPLGEWSRQYLRGPDGENLTDEWLSSQMSLSDAHRQFTEFAGVDAILGLQNAAFDKNVLEDELREQGIDWKPTGYIDTMDMSAMTLPKWTPENQDGPSMVGRDGERRASSSLKAITEYLDVELGDKHHTADADAEAAAMVMENLIARAIENDWTTDAIKPDTRREFVEKRKKEFDEKIAKFEEDKKSYLDALANESDSDKLSSGATKTKVRKYGDSKPDGEERFVRNSSTWLKGLSSKQIAELVVPESHEQYIEMLLDDYFPARDRENPGFVDAFKNNLIESMRKSPWIKGDYSQESIAKIKELVESSLEASPSLKWAFENFGAPMFVMLTPEGASLYENQPALRAQRERIMQSRGLKSEPFVRGVQFTGKDLISFNRKLIVDQMSNDPDFETSPLIADANHVVRPGRANIDIAASSTLSHEYGHWLQKRALRENERTATSVTGVKYGGEQIPSSRMPLVIRIAEMYENAEVDELIGRAHRDGMPLEATPSIPRTVTTYAHTNGREMIAEGLSAFFHPNPNVKNQAINKKLLDDVYRLLGLEPGEEPWSA